VTLSDLPTGPALLSIRVGPLLVSAVVLIIGASLWVAQRRRRDTTARILHPQAAQPAGISLEAVGHERPDPLQIGTDDPQLVTRMGHELRTPLNSVIGFSAVLLKNPGRNLSPQQLLYLERIRENGVHLLALVDHLLYASERRPGTRARQLTPVSVDRLVLGTIEELAAEAAHEKVLMRAELPADIRPITTDEHRFQAAFRSLVRGALPMAGHGRITVRVAAPAGRPSRIELSVSGPATARARGTAGADVFAAHPEFTLAASLYHLLGYPVTTAPAGSDETTISVMLDALRPSTAAADIGST
jgi:signal transduction histidine kinase